MEQLTPGRRFSLTVRSAEGVAPGRYEETLAIVFRSVHTLKGAAYTVGCAPIGDAAHQIEDLLGAVRENRLAMTPAVTEAIFVGTTAIKQVLQTGATISEETALALEGATQALRALMASAVGDRLVPVMAQENPLTPVAVPEMETAPASPAAPLVPVLPGFVRPEQIPDSPLRVERRHVPRAKVQDGPPAR